MSGRWPTRSPRRLPPESGAAHPGSDADRCELLQELGRGDGGAQLDRVQRHSVRALASQRRRLAVDAPRRCGARQRRPPDPVDAAPCASRTRARCGGSCFLPPPSRSATLSASPRATARSAQSAFPGREAVSARRCASTSAGSPSSTCRAAQGQKRAAHGRAVERQLGLQRHGDAETAEDRREERPFGRGVAKSDHDVARVDAAR